MKVYLALIEWDYEGSEVIGVYSTREKAKARLAEWPAYRDNEAVVEHEVQ